MYRRVRGRIAPEHVVGFLMLDQDFPRSVRYCLSRAEESLRAITGSPKGTFQLKAEKLLGRLRSEFEFTQAADIIHSGLHEFIDRVQLSINEVDAAIFDSFFATQPIANVSEQSQSQSQSQSSSTAE